MGKTALLAAATAVLVFGLLASPMSESCCLLERPWLCFVGEMDEPRFPAVLSRPAETGAFSFVAEGARKMLLPLFEAPVAPDLRVVALAEAAMGMGGTARDVTTWVTLLEKNGSVLCRCAGMSSAR